MRKFFREVLDPFEILYFFIAVATFTHTTWAASYMFEGVEPADSGAWYFHGVLIALAVDFGMLITSRFLVRATDRWSRISLLTAFVIAALVSFYSQVVYLVLHTPTIVLPQQIGGYWIGVLQPLLDARVIVLPLALPVMATVYTMARITNRRSESSRVVVNPLKPPRDTEIKVMTPRPGQLLLDERGSTSGSEDVSWHPLDGVIETFYENTQLDELGARFETADCVVDMIELKVTEKATGKTYGPYRSTSSMMGALRQASRRRMPPPT